MHGSEASLERVVLKPGILQNDGSEAMAHAERMVLKLLQNGWYRSISLFHVDSCTPVVAVSASQTGVVDEISHP